MKVFFEINKIIEYKNINKLTLSASASAARPLEARVGIGRSIDELLGCSSLASLLFNSVGALTTSLVSLQLSVGGVVLKVERRGVVARAILARSVFEVGLDVDSMVRLVDGDGRLVLLVLVV